MDKREPVLVGEVVRDLISLLRHNKSNKNGV